MEGLKRTVRDRKFLMDEVESVQKKVEELAKSKTLSRDQKTDALGKLLWRLNKLKRRLEETSTLEEADLTRLEARVEHLEALGPCPKDKTIPWNRHRVPRLLADYMLREGARQSAEMLTSRLGIEKLVDTHVSAWHGPRRPRMLFDTTFYEIIPSRGTDSISMFPLSLLLF